MFKQTTATVLALVFCSVLMAQDSPIVTSGSYSKIHQGKEAAFEKAVSAHISKWHGEGQWNQFGSRVTTGPRAGQYMIGTAGHYWKDYDNRVTTDAHDKDWSRITNTFVEESSGMNYFVKNLDASYNDRRSSMARITYYYCKPGGMGKMIEIMKKGKSASEDAKYERSVAVYILRGSGRDNVLAVVNRMDGMADMGPGSSTVRERWVAKYGEADFESVLETWRGSYTASVTEIHQLVEGMTTPPSN